METFQNHIMQFMTSPPPHTHTTNELHKDTIPSGHNRSDAINPLIKKIKHLNDMVTWNETIYIEKDGYWKRKHQWGGVIKEGGMATESNACDDLGSLNQATQNTAFWSRVNAPSVRERECVFYVEQGHNKEEKDKTKSSC